MEQYLPVPFVLYFGIFYFILFSNLKNAELYPANLFSQTVVFHKILLHLILGKVLKSKTDFRFALLLFLISFRVSLLLELFEFYPQAPRGSLGSLDEGEKFYVDHPLPPT